MNKNILYSNIINSISYKSDYALIIIINNNALLYLFNNAIGVKDLY